MDDVFRALADPTRRRLLDILREGDGQTLKALEDRIALTRFGVMKHLRVLEDAHMLTTRKVGREKFHYLNPVPIQHVADRWISRYAAPFAQVLNDLKLHVERKEEIMSSAPKQVYEVFIRGSAQAIWDAIVTGDQTRLYYYGSRIEGDWSPGGAFRYMTPDGRAMLDGEVVEIDAPHRLVTTFAAHWQPDFAGDKPSRVTWEITPMDDFCKLTVVHDEFEGETATYRSAAGGWSLILSGLKTLVETGQPLKAAA
jgi:uncharacterized protein YndB with AHSA1/START domain/DNA-binding transcriptional ArsR family regulator